MAGISVRVLGLEKAKLIPEQMTFALQRLREELLPPLTADFIQAEPPGGKWPKGRRRTIQQQTKGFIRGTALVIGTFGSRYARRLDRGGEVRPRKRGGEGVMRFRGQDGNFVFTRKVIRQPARPYFGRVLRNVPIIVRVVYERVFAGIGHG